MESFRRRSGFPALFAAGPINASNASQVKPVWVYDTKQFTRNWENTPLLVGGVLIVEMAPTADLAGIDPVTGKELWRRKGPEGRGGDYRGFSYWPGDGKMAGRLVVVNGPNMIGIDPNTGKNSTDWPQQGFNIMLPPVQGVVSGDDVNVGPAPGNTPRPNGAGARAVAAAVAAAAASIHPLRR